MTTQVETIVDVSSSLGSGLATLFVEKGRGVAAIPCEAGPASRALRSAFGDRVVGRDPAKAVAMQLGCDVSTVYKMARQGLIPHEWFGKLLVRFPVDTVEIMMGKKESQEDNRED